MTSHSGDSEEGEQKSRRKLGEYGKRAGRAALKGVKSSYHASNVGRDLSRLGGSLMDTVVGLPIRAVRGVVNLANYAARTVVGAPEAGARKLYQMVEGVEQSLDDRVRTAERHHENTITLSARELQALHYAGADQAVLHLDAKVRQAEEAQRTVHIPLSEAHKVLDYMRRHRTTDILERYRAAAAIISFVIALLSFDQVRLTGFAIGVTTGGYDYYSYFGFLFLALGIFLLCFERRRTRL